MGTTLEILAPYLPYGIEVEMLWFPLDEDRYMLCGLDSKAASPVLLGDSGATKACGLGACLPVLRSFADLCTPLEDGTVPAKRFVELNNGLTTDPKRHLKICEDGLYMDGWGNKDWRLLCSIEDFQAGECDLRAANYLRRHHFAVGLSESQYIRKEA